MWKAPLAPVVTCIRYTVYGELQPGFVARDGAPCIKLLRHLFNTLFVSHVDTRGRWIEVTEAVAVSEKG